MKNGENNKIAFIDSLKIILTVLVVLHHAFITYGSEGSWYFTEKTTYAPARIILSFLTATNQTFFMGFFFFLSSYFIESSIRKKGRWVFLTERFRRLGIPLVFYSIILSPCLNYLAEHYGKGQHRSFSEYMHGYRHWIDFGVLWFVAALLFFNMIFVFFKIKKDDPKIPESQFPGARTIFLFALGLGAISYLVRGISPLGWTLKPLGFQLGHFPQYVALFYLGILASRHKWADGITYKMGRQWLFIAAICTVIVLPLLYEIIIHINDGGSINGNFSWQSLFYPLWEQITGIAFIAGLFGVARYKWNVATRSGATMARACYGVYIFHPLVLVCVALAAKQISVEPLVKLSFVAPFAVIGSFILASVITRIPYINEII